MNCELMSPLIWASPPGMLPVPLTLMGGYPSELEHFTPSCFNPPSKGAMGLFDREGPPVKVVSPVTKPHIGVTSLRVVPDSPQKRLDSEGAK